MPRKSSRKPKKKKDDGSNTYYKAKNGRFYKKIEVDGKTRVRFVSNAEAMGTIKPKAKKVKKQEPEEEKTTTE